MCKRINQRETIPSLVYHGLHSVLHPPYFMCNTVSCTVHHLIGLLSLPMPPPPRSLSHLPLPTVHCGKGGHPVWSSRGVLSLAHFTSPVLILHPSFFSVPLICPCLPLSVLDRAGQALCLQVRHKPFNGRVSLSLSLSPSHSPSHSIGFWLRRSA